MVVGECKVGEVKMEIFEAFTSYLLTDTECIEPKRLNALTNLRTIIGDKLYPDEAPEGTQPDYIVYQNISDVPGHTLQGESTLKSPVYQFTIYASSKKQAATIGRYFRAAFSDFRGTMGGLNIQYIELLNELYSRYTSDDVSADVLYLEYQIYFDRS
jgi:hypothetical protein